MGGISFGDWQGLLKKVDDIHASVVRIESDLAGVVLTQEGIIMGLREELAQNMTDLRDLAHEYLAFIITKDDMIADRDAAIAARDAQIVDLLAQLAAGQITVTEMQTQVADANATLADAIAASQAAEDALRAGLPGVPPVGGTPLQTAYPERTSFDAAVAAYTGPEAVTLDGAEVKAGVTPAMDFFSHSVTGEINTTGPTD